MDAVIKFISGPLPIGTVVLIVVAVSYTRISDISKRLGKLEDHFLNHLKNHIEKGGDT